MMKKLKFLIISIFLILFISGCIEDFTEKDQEDQTGRVSGENEALKLEVNYPEKVLPGQTFIIRVHLLNQVGRDIRNINLYFNNPYTLDIISVDNKNCQKDSYFASCHFDEMFYPSEIFVNFAVQAPTEEELGSIERTLKPEMTLTYDFDGETIFKIPIVKEGEEPEKAKMELYQTPGPIHLKIERGVTSSEKEWELEGNIFGLVMKFEDVVNPASRITIESDNTRIELTNLIVNESIGPCDDFKNVTENILQLKRNETLPMSYNLACIVKAKEINEPWTYGIVRATYNYTYIVKWQGEINIVKSITG